MREGILVICALLTVLFGYAWFEAGWLRMRSIEVAIPRLPEAFEGLRITHLSDFHLGAAFSRGNRATERAAEWVVARRPDLVCVTGDLVSHPRGQGRLGTILARLDGAFVVLGNHDVAITRDPFSYTAELRDVKCAILLRDASAIVEQRGERISIVGVDPKAYRAKRSRPHMLVDDDAGLRVLLCHFPTVVDRLPIGAFDLILTGHLHAGQLCLPFPGRRITLAHPTARFVAGVYETNAGAMHVSPGTGTTFVPFRFFARPEVTELVLRRRI